jgi:hypothetical protein
LPRNNGKNGRHAKAASPNETRNGRNGRWTVCYIAGRHYLHQCAAASSIDRTTPLPRMTMEAIMSRNFEAERFLKLLDSNATAFEFRTIDDDRERDDKSLTQTFYGTLAQHAGELQRLNSKGAGVFVTINETNGKGRKTEDIIRVRAVFADLDGAPLEPVQQNRQPPHIIVQSSPGRFHPYWLVDHIPLEDFSAVQKAIIEQFDSDDTIHDLPRIMRVPGFFHRKREPFFIRIISTIDAPPYAGDRFRRCEEPSHISGTKQPATEDDLILAAGALEVLPPTLIWKHRNNIGMATWLATDGAMEGFEAWCGWLERSGRFNRKAAERQWLRYFKSQPSRIGLGTLIFLADQADPNWRTNLWARWSAAS